MMMLYRLVRMIEDHSQALACCLLARVQSSGATPDYKNVSPHELKERVYEIYKHLGDWLMTKDELDLELRYSEIGARRASQGVPLSQVMWAIVLTKENLWEYIKNKALVERPVEVFGEMEMLQLLDQFFDRAIYYAATGYERATAARAITQAGTAAEAR